MRVDFGPVPFGRTVGDNRSTLFIGAGMRLSTVELRVPLQI